MKIKAVTNDKCQLDLNWNKINTYLSRWKPGTPIDVEIVRRQKKKSDPMRKYYFAAVLPPFMKELGYEADEEILFHHQLKVTYFESTHGVHQDERGMWRNVPSVFGNDSGMDISLKKAFVDWVIRKAAHYNVYIEDPAILRVLVINNTHSAQQP